MNKLTISVYRQPKHDWTPLLRFGNGRTRTSSDGWHSYPYNTPRLRTMGARLKNSVGTILENKVFHTGVYGWFNNQTGDILEIKYDPTKITSLWYRYSNVSEILFDLNTATNLEVISLREHMVNFGNLQIPNLSKLRKFDISKGGSIDDVSFHPNALIDLFYLGGTLTATPAIDSIILHAFNSPVNNGSILNSGIMPSEHLCDECDALIARGWHITTYPICGSTVQSAWRPINPYCIIQNEPPVIGELRYVSSTYDSIRLEWDAATDSDGIASYTIYYANNDDGVVQTQTVSGTSLTTTITGLQTGGYSFTIVATDNAGSTSAESNGVAGSTSIPSPGGGAEPVETPGFTFTNEWQFEDAGALEVNNGGSLRNYTESTMPAGALWSIQNNGYGLRVDWENSGNCPGGVNYNTQYINASVTINAPTEELIYIGWKGQAELELSGFENVTVKIDGVLIGTATSPGGGLKCQMGDIVPTNNYPDGYTLSPGTHTITVSGDTGDEEYHVDAYYEFVFSKNPITDF